MNTADFITKWGGLFADTPVANITALKMRDFTDDTASLIVDILPSTGRTFYISTTGNNATGAVGRQDKPYLTLGAVAPLLLDGDIVKFSQGTFTINTTVNITKKVKIEGNNTTINTTMNNVILSIESDNVSIVEINFVGDGKATGKVFQYAIGLDGYQNVNISNCNFEAFGGIGVSLGNTLISNEFGQGGKITNCIFYNNNYGLFFTTRGEYTSTCSCVFYSNTLAIQNNGGNNLISNSQICKNVDGFCIGAGTNNGHGVISNCNINHNTGFGVKILDTALGYIFSGCNIYENDIYIKNSSGVSFSDCQVDVGNYYFENSFKCKFDNVDIINSYANTFNNGYLGTNQDVIFTNFKVAGAEPITASLVANTTLNLLNHIARVNSASGAYTITLPRIIKSGIGKEYVVIDLGDNASVNNITIATTGGDTVNGDSNYVIKNNGGRITLKATGATTWEIIGTGILSEDIITGAISEQVHTTGATVTINNTTTILYVNPATTLAALTITLPASPINGQEVKISFGGAITSGAVITTLSIIGNTGHTILAGTSITSANAGVGYILKFQSSLNLWRLY